MKDSGELYLATIIMKLDANGISVTEVNSQVIYICFRLIINSLVVAYT